MVDARVVAYFLGTNRDWGGASRALLNFVKKVDRQRFRPLVVIPQAGPIEQELADLGIACAVWDIHDRGANLLGYARAIGRAVGFLRRHRVAIAHLNYGAVGWKPAEILAARILRIPVINHLHTAVAQTSSYLKYTQALVGVSGYVCRGSAHRGVPCHVVHNVADFERFGAGISRRSELGLPQDAVVVGFFGQVRRIKGILLFLEMAKRLPGPNLRFLIAGELRGEDTFRPEEFNGMIAVDPRVVYLGYRDDIQDLYASCDVIVMPSQWEEPCAMVLFEGSAAGKPIVASATGGTSEILKDGETGFLFERTDVARMTECVARLVEDGTLRSAIGTQARSRAMNEFAHGPVRELERLYDRLLGA